MDKLVLNFKEAVVKEYPFERDTFSIGRKPENDIAIDNPIVSSQHARIFRQGGQVFIEDLNSTNGTFVNKKKISKSQLHHKDVVYIGKHTLTYISDNPDAQTAAAVARKEDLDKTMVLQSKEHVAMQGGKTAAIGGFSVIEGDLEQREYELKARLSTIGKADTSTVKIKGFFTPKTAALVNRSDQGYAISPPAEGAKIKLNGNAVEGRTPLKDGDLIELYGVKLQFFLQGS